MAQLAVIRYGVAVVCVTAAVILDLWLRPALDPEVLLVGAVLISGWISGFWPGLLAALLGTLALAYFFTPPLNSFLVDITLVPRLMMFALLAVSIAAVAAVRRGAEQSLKSARDELERRVHDRTAELERSNEQLLAEIGERARAEEALRERANLLDLTHDTVFVRTMDDVITLWNRGAEERYGWTRHEAIGRISHQLLKTVFPKPLESIIEELNRTRRWEGELIHTRRDGTTIVAASRWALQTDAQGTPVAILETNNDITARKQAEAELRASERRHRHIFQAIGVSIWEEDFSRVKAAIDDLRAQGVDFRQYVQAHPEFVSQAIAMVRLVDVNDATVTLFGAQSREELLVSLDRVFTPETYNVFARELIAIAEGRTSFESETVLRTLQGDELAVVFTITFPPPPSALETVLVSIIDISERKRAEDRIQQQANLLEQTHDAIIVWEFPRTIIYWNRGAERLYGFSKAEALGRVTHELLQTDHQMSPRSFEELVERDGQWSGELSHTTRDGRKIIVDSLHVLMRAADGRQLVLETNRDITERKRAEQALEELAGRLIRAQEEERSRIGRELHDHISQMLGVLTIRIDQLYADPEVTPRIAEGLDQVRQGAVEVTDDVRHLSHRLHSSMLDYLGLAPALQKLAAEFSERCKIPVRFANASLPTSLPSDIALALFRIAEESLTNIAKHSRARSASIAIHGGSDGIHLTVEDDGNGFDVMGLASKGGLGFVSMQERLRVLHGTVRVDSALSRGTKIDVWVPSTSVVASAPVDSQQAASTGESASRVSSA
jgi:PAS domain S-box-containing protein